MPKIEVDFSERDYAALTELAGSVGMTPESLLAIFLTDLTSQEESSATDTAAREELDYWFGNNMFPRFSHATLLQRLAAERTAAGAVSLVREIETGNRKLKALQENPPQDLTPEELAQKIQNVQEELDDSLEDWNSLLSYEYNDEEEMETFLKAVSILYPETEEVE